MEVDVKSENCRPSLGGHPLKRRLSSSSRQGYTSQLFSLGLNAPPPKASCEPQSVQVPVLTLAAPLVSFLHHTEISSNVFAFLCLADAPAKPH